MPSLFSNYREFIWGLIGLAVVLLIIIVLGAAGWPGAANTCATGTGGCYCENIDPHHPELSAIFAHPGMFAQPVNTWSNIGFMLLGLTMLWWIGWERATGRSPAHRNLLTTTTWVMAFYGFMTVFLGPGSMMFHASMRQWAGWFDPLSMNLFLGFVPAYNLVRRFQWPVWVGIVIYLGLNVVEGILNAAAPDQSLIWFICMGVIALASQVLVGFSSLRTATSGVVFFWVGWGVFATAMLVWWLSWTGNPLCNPNTFFQGHGLWHILSAAAVGCLYMYFRAEDAAQ
jgi:hypothetical protein